MSMDKGAALCFLRSQLVIIRKGKNKPQHTQYETCDSVTQQVGEDPGSGLRATAMGDGSCDVEMFKDLCPCDSRIGGKS